MSAKPSEGPAWDADKTWRALVKLLHFGDRLDFVFFESDSMDTFRAWRDALREHCRSKDQPFREPKAGQGVLDWLEEERARGVTEDAERGEDRPREIYIGTIPQDGSERVVFGRINENRDNLVRSLNGALILAGAGDFVRRLAYAAPSVWAMRTKSFTLQGPPPSAVAAPAKRSNREVGFAAKAASPSPPAAERIPAAAPPSPGAAPLFAASAPPFAVSAQEASDEAFVASPAQVAEDEPMIALDVLVTCAGHDEAAARDLKRRIEAEGFRCAIALDSKGLSEIEAARVVVVLLSSNYAYSKSWDALAQTRMAKEEPARLRAKLVPILLQDAVIPGLMSGLTPLDFRSPDSRAYDHGRLLRMLSGERDLSQGPGLAPARYELSGDASWLTEAPLDWGLREPRALLDLLMDAYPDFAQMKNLASRADILLDTWSSQGGSLRSACANLLDSAARQRKLRPLIDVVLADPGSAAHHHRIRQIIGEG